jgi:hypothetical protein
MRQDIPPNDPRSIWQSQGKEHATMSVEEIRLNAFAMQTKVRRNLVVTMVFGGVLLILSVMAVMKLPSTSPRMITAALMVLVGVLVYRAARIFWAPETLPQDAGLNACLDFYRRELTVQHRAAGGTWIQSLLEVLLLAAVVWVSIHATVRFEPARILLPAFFVLVILARYMKARRIKRELRQLDDFEKENNQCTP